MTNTRVRPIQATKYEKRHSHDPTAGALTKPEEYSSVSTSYPLPKALPLDIVGIAVSFLDGESILNCSSVCVAWEQMCRQREVWKHIVIQKWPTLRRHVLAQLPGAPDYDLIRLYGGCWKQCFTVGNKLDQSAEMVVQIPRFSTRELGERVVSDTFNIGEHHFCLWIYPRGNPHEADYAGRVLSVYLVLTDLDKRMRNWVTCAVFTLKVHCATKPQNSLEWHSCLGDNRFDEDLFNWGVHSLGSLDVLSRESSGFLVNDTLTVSAHVRLMTISFRVILEGDCKKHNGFGLADLTKGVSFELPFCCTSSDLMLKLRDDYNFDPKHIRIWCFNQPVASGKSLRPRKLISQDDLACRRPMFTNVLTDGVDIDAYSFCQIYVENVYLDDAPLDLTSTDSVEDINGFIFVKIVHHESNSIQFLGRVFYAEDLTIEKLYFYVARRMGWSVAEMTMFKEEIIPSAGLVPVPSSSTVVSESKHPVLACADIVIFERHVQGKPPKVQEILQSNLNHLYDYARQLLSSRCGMLTLKQIEDFAEKLDIPKFRVRNAFRKCKEDPRRTLGYIMEGRHLGFICDSCGQTDFRGPRFNCNVCSDYDLCSACAATFSGVTHRYANIDGKWQRMHDFTDHKSSHSMTRVFPVFFR